MVASALTTEDCNKMIDGDKLYLLNIMGHGVSVKVVPFVEIPQPKAHAAETES